MILPDDRASRSEEALLAAHQYYELGMSMDDIAADLGTSRSTVSRLLSHARDTGLVEIRVLRPHARAVELEDLLAERFDVEAQVTHVPSAANAVERLERTASHAARMVASMVDSDMVLAISWGTMVNAISRYLEAKDVTNCQIVLLNGQGNSRGTGAHYSSAVMDAFASAFNASVQQLPLPLFFDSEGMRELLFKERSVRHVTELQSSADIALFNVGTVSNGVPSGPYLSGYFLDEEDYAVLRADGAVGDIATTFFTLSGEYRDVRFNARTSGPNLGAFMKIQTRICVTSGEHKVDALMGALRGGFITHLAIDEHTAGMLLERHG